MMSLSPFTLTRNCLAIRTVPLGARSSWLWLALSSANSNRSIGAVETGDYPGSDRESCDFRYAYLEYVYHYRHTDRLPKTTRVLEGGLRSEESLG